MSHVDDGRLHAYLDGALSSAESGAEEERRAVEAHVRQCPDCRSRLDQAREDREAAGEILDLLAPDEIVAPTFEELTKRRRRESGGSGAPAWMRLSWAATVILALGGGWMARGVVAPSIEQDAPPAATETVADARSQEAPQVSAEPTVDDEPPEVHEPPATQETPPEQAPPAEQVATAPPPEVAADVVGDVAADVVAGVAGAAEPARETPSPVPSDAVADDVAVLADRATAQEAWSPVSPADAARELGHPPLDLDGVPWEHMEMAWIEDQILVRTVHPLEGGERVELVQAAPAPSRRDEDVAVLFRSRAREEITIAPTTFSDQRTGARAAPAEAPGEPVAEEAPVLLTGAELDRVRILLRGSLDRAVLEGLLQKLR